MHNPLEFYQQEKQYNQNELVRLKKKLSASSLIRLVVFLSTVFLIYLFFSQVNIAIAIAVTGLLVFIFLVSKHTDLQLKRDLVKALIKINQVEISALNDDYFDLDAGDEFIDHAHHYSYDIDLFGKGSFFQFCNRTATFEGKKKLANLLTSDSIENIKNKQEAIRELAKKSKWRQSYTATASLTKVEYASGLIKNWVHNYTTVFPKFLMVFSKIFMSISLLTIALVIFNIVNFQALMIWFFIGLGISGTYIKKVNDLYGNATKAKDTFNQYHQLLDKIETENFTSIILKEKQQLIQNDTKKASIIFKDFSKLLDALDQRNNILIAIVANGLFLRDINISLKVEKWMDSNHHQVEKWFDVIAFFDAYNSLANYAYNQPKTVYPTINKDDEFTIASKNLGHPLIHHKKRINNHFSVKKQEFFITTGANMAGKSTFLRTISLSIIMANMGLPICAETFLYSPIKLITSMRTSDNLTEETSYFFSELKRLKFIVDAIKRDTYFIVLDEILKGTNSTDKAIGSKKFVEKLVASGSTGIIATHDLSLCEIEKELTQIKNYYFDAEIIDDELNFDYKLKNGICKNMNASFLLKKMKII